MDLKTLSHLFSGFSARKLKSFTKNHLAHANESYIVTTEDDQKYVIKILLAQDAEGANTETFIQQEIMKAGIVTPRYLALVNGDIVGNINGSIFTVSEFITGARDDDVSPELFFSMGKTIAKTHQALDGATIPTNEAQWLALANIKHDLQEYRGSFRPQLVEALATGLSFLEYNLPISVIHGDFTFSNIFTVKGQVTAVFDFETAQNAPRILDIARTFLSLRRETTYSGETILTKLVEGYNSAAAFSLTTSELAHLKDAVKYTAMACAIWCANHDQEDATDKYMALSKEVDEVVNNTLRFI